MSIELVMLSNQLILYHWLLLLPSVFPSIRVFSNESALHIRWPKYWNFSFSNSPSNEYSGLISFRIDWFDLLAVQGTLKNLLQHHSSKAWILRCPAFFIAQLSHPYMTTGKTIALTIRTFVGKVMSLLFNMLSRFVITFLSRLHKAKFYVIPLYSHSTLYYPSHSPDHTRLYWLAYGLVYHGRLSIHHSFWHSGTMKAIKWTNERKFISMKSPPPLSVRTNCSFYVLSHFFTDLYSRLSHVIIRCVQDVFPHNVSCF